MWGDQNIAILTLKTGLLSVFFTEKRYRSINIGYLSTKISNTIPLRVCLISELRCLTRIFAVREGSLQCSTVEPPTDYYLNFCNKMDTKLVNDTQQSIVVVVEPLLLAPCTACRISLLPRPLRIERKSADPSGLSAIYH